MSETIASILISAAILAILALFVPCMESLARLLRSHSNAGETSESDLESRVKPDEVA